MLIHPFEPIWMPQSKTLILGTFPSVLSREQGFYYSHPRNRFWTLISKLFDEALPISIYEKTAILLRHSLALSDVLMSCDIIGSDDTSIKQPVPNDIAALVKRSAITEIYCNGKKAYTLYQKYYEIAVPAGDDFYTADLDTENGIVRIGAMICYDREFPESARLLMLKGAEIPLVPNACPMEINRLAQLRARAFENMVGIATVRYMETRIVVRTNIPLLRQYSRMHHLDCRLNSIE